MNGMQIVTRPLVHIAAEHRDLQRRAAGLIRLVREPLEEQFLPAVFAELSLQVRELHAVLNQHFAQEAAGGYLEEAVARVPRLAPEADAVERQHPGLLREVATLREMLTIATPSAEAWKQIGGAVAEFAAALLAHEAAENRILQAGFNEDPALLDLD